MLVYFDDLWWMENDVRNSWCLFEYDHSCMTDVVDLRISVYVIFEILIYYTWIRSFLMLNVNLPSSDFFRLAIVKWCRRASWGRLSRREYRGLAWGFFIFFAFESSLGSDYGLLGVVLLYSMLDLYGDLLGLV